MVITKLLTRSVTFCLLLSATASSKTGDVPPVVNNSNDNLAVGNPGGATASTASPTNYLLVKSQYVVGYNRDQGKPIWVSKQTSATPPGKAAFGPTLTCPVVGIRLSRATIKPSVLTGAITSPMLTARLR
jgi:DNA/RNA endonuclease G (NUC1)